MKHEDMMKAKPGDLVFFDKNLPWAKDWQGAVVCRQPSWLLNGLAFHNEKGYLGTMSSHCMTHIYHFGNRKSAAITKLIEEEHPGGLFCALSREGIRRNGKVFIKTFDDYRYSDELTDAHAYNLKLMLASWFIHMDEEDLNLFINEE